MSSRRLLAVLAALTVLAGLLVAPPAHGVVVAAVYQAGDATDHGDILSPAAGGVVALARTPSGGGYWIASATGEISARGTPPTSAAPPTSCSTSPWSTSRPRRPGTATAC